jgi:hypothetical protein
MCPSSCQSTAPTPPCLRTALHHFKCRNVLYRPDVASLQLHATRTARTAYWSKHVAKIIEPQVPRTSVTFFGVPTTRFHSNAENVLRISWNDVVTISGPPDFHGIARHFECCKHAINNHGFEDSPHAQHTPTWHQVTEAVTNKHCVSIMQHSRPKACSLSMDWPRLRHKNNHDTNLTKPQYHPITHCAKQCSNSTHCAKHHSTSTFPSLQGSTK